MQAMKNMLNHLQEHPIIGFVCATATPIIASIVTTLTADNTVKLVSTFSIYMGAAVGFLTATLLLIKLCRQIFPVFKKMAVTLVRALKRPGNGTV